MKPDDTAGVLEVVGLLWPHSHLGADPTKVLALWASMLADFTPAEVEGAVRELAAAGREHAPPVGVVVATCAERATGVPPWDVAWPALEAKARECVTPKGYRIPAVAEFEHSHVGDFARTHWRDICPLPAESAMETLRAQLRDAYRAAAGRVARDRALEAVGAPRSSGPRRLEVGAVAELERGAV